MNRALSASPGSLFLIDLCETNSKGTGFSLDELGLWHTFPVDQAVNMRVLSKLSGWPRSAERKIWVSHASIMRHEMYGATPV